MKSTVTVLDMNCEVFWYCYLCKSIHRNSWGRMISKTKWNSLDKHTLLTLNHLCCSQTGVDIGCVTVYKGKRYCRPKIKIEFQLFVDEGQPIERVFHYTYESFRWSNVFDWSRYGVRVYKKPRKNKCKANQVADIFVAVRSREV